MACGSAAADPVVELAAVRLLAASADLLDGDASSAAIAMAAELAGSCFCLSSLEGDAGNFGNCLEYLVEH